VHVQGRGTNEQSTFFNPFRQTDMTTVKINKNDHESKLSLHAGVDVGSEELILVVRKNSKPFDPQKFTNTPADRARLVKKLAKLPGIIVCLEATGIYHFDLAVALHDAGVSLMVINPKASHNFAKVLIPKGHK